MAHLRPHFSQTGPQVNAPMSLPKKGVDVMMEAR